MSSEFNEIHKSVRELKTDLTNQLYSIENRIGSMEIDINSIARRQEKDKEKANEMSSNLNEMNRRLKGIEADSERLSVRSMSP